MPKTVDYECENEGCDYVYEELFGDTEHQPAELLGHKCVKCGGNLKKGLNLKNNSQVWGVHKL